MTAAQPWIRTLDSSASTRLFVFNHAGGGTVEGRKWVGKQPGLDVCPVVLPGREGRLAEPVVSTMRPLADAAVTGLRSALDLPYVIYGHSMGAWLAYEVVHGLVARGLPLPMGLVVGARRAPSRPGTLPPISHLPQAAFLDALGERYGAIPEALRNSPAMLRMFVPPLRADFSVLDSYRWEDRAPLPVPILGLRGTEDSTVTPADLAAWREHTSVGFASELVAGGHFFHRDASVATFERIASAVKGWQ